jgi:hypothetical protein
MNRTGWLGIYRNCRRDMLVRLTEVGPRWLHSQDVRLGCHDGADLISLAGNGKRIWILLQAVAQALDRCEETGLLARSLCPPTHRTATNNVTPYTTINTSAQLQ